MKKLLFFKDETGAVTVDFVVLTAAIVGLGSAVMTTTAGGTTGLAGTISAYLGDTKIGNYLPVVAISANRGIRTDIPANCPKGGIICQPGGYAVSTQYGMSDGTALVRTTTYLDGQAPVESWSDLDGNAVDAPKIDLQCGKRGVACG